MLPAKIPFKKTKAGRILFLPGMLQRRFHAVLVHGINLPASVGFAPRKMDAEMSVKIIIFNRARAMRHPIHGGSIYMSVVFDENCPSLPAPVAEDAFHDPGIFGTGRFTVRMVGSCPAFDGENLSRFYILNLEGGMMRNGIRMFEPVQAFRRISAFSAAAGSLDSTGAVHF